MYRKIVFLFWLLIPLAGMAQFNTDRLVTVGRSALYYEDYVLSIQYFNQAIDAKPYLYEPWFYRAVAKYYLDDYVGAESDCTEALDRNPFVVKVYELRGLTRIQQKKYDAAVGDYVRALRYDPENQGLWHNRVLCRIYQEDYDGALADIDTMLTKWSRSAKAYSMQAEVYLHRKDTASAEAALEKSIAIDEFDAGVWAVRSGISFAREDWEKAEEYLGKAIHLQPKVAGYYINRALARIKRNNLRGAMADYDTALDFEPGNFLGHYNRGLLRAHIGDDNRAITDFDFVLNLEPDNTMALLNRAILLDKTGDLRAAIRDYSKVIDEFPNFWTGLINRAGCYRRLGMTKQAEADEFKVYKARLYKTLYGRQPRLDKKKLRKRSDIDPDKYNQLVVADEQEAGPEYESEYRGRVQNRAADMEYMPMYELSYERIRSEIKTYVPFDGEVENFNQSVAGSIRRPRVMPVYVNSGHQTVEERNPDTYFIYIDSLTAEISSTADKTRQLPLLLMRSVAYSMVQNFESAIDDASACIQMDSTSALAYWQRAVSQSRQNEFNASQGTDVTMKTANVLSDLTDAIAAGGQSAYLYYNRGNVYAGRKDYVHAEEDYTSALKLDGNMAEAYYNRGLVRLAEKKVQEGVGDLSKAGELGLYKAYSVIKKYMK